MSVTMKCVFLAGRYHATPWGKHVNEGVPEWPPSPWRLLRALVAVWRRTLPEIPADDIRRVLEPLCECPLFFLPAYRTAHTRYYMPWEKKQKRYDDRTLVFDTFVALRRDEPLFIHWEGVELSDDQRSLLDRLVRNITFLGRAESWVECSLADRVPEKSLERCYPAGPDDFDPVRVLCPAPGSCFDDSCFPALDTRRKAASKNAPGELLFDCPRWHLCLDTSIIRGNRWNIVPGARWVDYTRPRERGPSPERTRRAHAGLVRPNLARFIIDGPVLPLVTETIRVAEAFRRAVMSCFRAWCERNPDMSAPYRVAFRRAGGTSEHDDADSRGEKEAAVKSSYASRTLSGKDKNGSLLSGHRHAYYLPVTDPSYPHRISSVVVYAREGFDEAEREALMTLSEVKAGLDGVLRVRVVELGMACENDPTLVGPSSVWHSLTPYLGHESIGTRARVRYLRKGLRREWKRLASQVEGYGGVELLSVEELTPEELAHMQFPQAWAYRRARVARGGIEPYRAAGMFRLVFSKPIAGPLGLGYACHFGMGLFGAETTRA